jgi:hypothetical protein
VLSSSSSTEEEENIRDIQFLLVHGLTSFNLLREKFPIFYTCENLSTLFLRLKNDKGIQSDWQNFQSCLTKQELEIINVRLETVANLLGRHLIFEIVLIVFNFF